MIRDKIQGFNRIYTLDELISVVQYKIPFDVLDENNLPYYKDMTPTEQNGEEFREYPKDRKIEISNLGRVRIGNKILYQVDDIKLGYLYCPEYAKNEYGNPLYVYQLVVDTWLENHPITTDRWARHHINNNGYDNRPENLIWLTWSEHSKIPKPTKIRDN